MQEQKHDCDGGYHSLFSNPMLVEDMLRNFVPEAWVQQLDFSAMQRVNAKFHADNLQRREGDIIFRIPYRENDDEVYLYLLLEFQSTPDKWMASRILVYAGLLQQYLIKEKQLTDTKQLPPVFPLVLYNGEKPWRAPLDLHALIGLPAHSPLRNWQPQMRYFLLDESQYPQGKSGSVSGMIMRIENIEDIHELRKCLLQLEKMVPEVEVGLRRAILMWLKHVISPHKGLELPIAETEKLSEVREMLSTRIGKWAEDAHHAGKTEGLAEGHAKGQTEGQVRMLKTALKLKFGDLPQDIETRIDQAGTEQIDEWFIKVLTVDSIKAVFD